MNKEFESSKSWKYGDEPFFPNHLLKQAIQAILLFALLVFLSYIAPAPLPPKADPYTVPQTLKPDWYFLAAHQFLELADRFSTLGSWAPKFIAVIAEGVGGLLLLCLPFLDKNPHLLPGKRPIALRMGISITIAYFILTIWGYYS